MRIGGRRRAGGRMLVRNDWVVVSMGSGTKL